MRSLPCVTTPEIHVGSRKSTWKYGWGSPGNGLHPGSITILREHQNKPMSSKHQATWKIKCFKTLVDSLSILCARCKFIHILTRWEILTRWARRWDGPRPQDYSLCTRTKSADHNGHAHPPIPEQKSRHLIIFWSKKIKPVLETLTFFVFIHNDSSELLPLWPGTASLGTQRERKNSTI